MTALSNYEVLAEDDDTKIVLTAKYVKRNLREPTTLANARYTGEYELTVFKQVDDGERLNVPFQITLTVDDLEELRLKITDLLNRTTGFS